MPDTAPRLLDVTTQAAESVRDVMRHPAWRDLPDYAREQTRLAFARLVDVEHIILRSTPRPPDPAPRMLDALRAIADMRTGADTDHAQLTALMTAIARIAIDEATRAGAPDDCAASRIAAAAPPSWCGGPPPDTRKF